ncbi:MAG TPA: hypothetical protein VJQ06_05245 [Rhizomicrobium sp.]|nr:hypothetical protein [Rhizomicrobium sp.]
MSGGGTTQVQKNELDPQLKALYMQNYGTAMNVANTPFQAYSGERVAPLNVTQNSANDLFRSIAGNNVGKSMLDQASSAMGGMLSYRPQTINASPIAGRSIAPTPIGFNPITPNSITADPITAGMLKDTDLSPYFNPYTQNVIDTSLADLARARDIQRVADNQHSTLAKAFGGGRQGVADSQTNDNYFRNVSRTSGELRNAGYNAAVNAATADINRKLGADQFNSGQQFGADQFNAGQRLTADTFNSSQKYGADQFNSGQTFGADQFNANLGFAADQFNSGQAFNAAQTNAANDMAGAGFRSNAASALAGFSDQELMQALQRAGALGTAGSIEQQNRQAMDDAAYEEFLRQAAYPQQQQDIRNAALGMIPLEQTQTATTRNSPNVAGMIGTGLSAAAMA